MISMGWSRSVPHLPRSPGTAPVPDIDGLRRAALQASWRRDRRVAQHRMAFRWIAWYALRGVPLLAIGAATWLWVLPHLAGSALAPANPPVQRASPKASASVASVVPVASIASVAPVTPAAMAAPPKPAMPELQRGEPGLELRLERPLEHPLERPFQRPFQPGLPATGAQAANAQSAKESPSPQLKPDNWLHSQEP